MKQSLLVPELRELLEANDMQTLRKFCERSHPETAAELLSGLEPGEIWRILQALPVGLRATIFSYFDLDEQVELAGYQNRREMARLLEEMPPDDRVDLVQRLDENLRDGILPLVARAEREDIRRLASYEEGTAGSVMTTDYAVLRPDLSVPQALQQIRSQAASREMIYYIYVVDEGHHLLGYVSLEDLILGRPSQTVAEIMRKDAISVLAADDQEHVARQIEKYDLISVPVINEDNVLVGSITVDDILDVAEAEATEDIQKMGGTEPLDLPYTRTGFLELLRKRGGWLSALFLGEMLTASAMGHFERDIAAAVVLALFIPLIISSGGNSGSQAATLIIRALALGELHLRDWWRVLLREAGSGISLGAWLGLIGFFRVVLWQHMGWIDYGPHYVLVAFTVWASLVGVVCFGTITGSMLPFLLRGLGFDPATSSAPFVATLVDVTGLVIYFSTALLILRGTLL